MGAGGGAGATSPTKGVRLASPRHSTPIHPLRAAFLTTSVPAPRHSTPTHQLRELPYDDSTCGVERREASIDKVSIGGCVVVVRAAEAVLAQQEKVKQD